MKDLSINTDLVEQCIRGSRDAQYSLYRKYSSAMYNICLRMLGTKMDAEDVLQTAFVDIFQNLKKFRGESSIGSWIKRIVINNCLNHIKKNKVIINDLSENEYELATEEEEKVQYDIQAVHKAIMKLPEGYRVVLNLYLLEGYSHEEIGNILDVTTSTSKSQYSRAKAKLKDIIRSRDHLKIEL